MDSPEVDVTTLSGQEELFMRYWVDAYDYALRRLQEGRQRLAQLALRRFRQGFHEFGATMFLDGNSDYLAQMIDEELADSITWGIGHQCHIEIEQSGRVPFVRRTSSRGSSDTQ